MPIFPGCARMAGDGLGKIVRLRLGEKQLSRSTRSDEPYMWSHIVV